MYGLPDIGLGSDLVDSRDALDAFMRRPEQQRMGGYRITDPMDAGLTAQNQWDPYWNNWRGQAQDYYTGQTHTAPSGIPSFRPGEERPRFGNAFLNNTWGQNQQADMGNAYGQRPAWWNQGGARAPAEFRFPMPTLRPQFANWATGYTSRPPGQFGQSLHDRMWDDQLFNAEPWQPTRGPGEALR